MKRYDHIYQQKWLECKEKVFREGLEGVSKENNEILRKIRRGNRWSMALRSTYWLIIIGLSIGAFYFVQPYIDEVMDTYKGIKSTQEKASNFTQNFSWGSIQDYFTGTSTAQ